MFKCKRCGGTLYEEEIFYDEDNVKHMQVGCYSCPDKIYVEYTKWLDFTNKIRKALKQKS